MEILRANCSVPLKSKLGVMDLHHLICDVRRRVEHEVTFEGLERRIKCVSLLIQFRDDSASFVILTTLPLSFCLALCPRYYPQLLIQCSGS